MVQSHGCLHLVPPLPARAASAVPFLTAILQERGIFQPEPVVPRSSPHRFHQRIPLKRVCCSCLSPLWHAAIVRLGWAAVNATPAASSHRYSPHAPMTSRPSATEAGSGSGALDADRSLWASGSATSSTMPPMAMGAGNGVGVDVGMDVGLGSQAGRD